jgi:lipopolysaccharide export system ATP-binding protein
VKASSEQAEGRAALRACGVRVRLGGVDILRGVDLQVEGGTVMGVLGPSGAGKSTLFRALVGELQLAAGQVWLAARDVSRWPLWRRARAGLGYVPQTPSVLLDLAVRDNIATFQRAARARRRAPREWAASVQLESRLDVVASDLSGGERRRLEILRALMGSPRVLVCDEPLAGVDPAGARRLGEVLRAEAKRGAAVVLADHRIAEALPFCDEALLLVDGRVELIAPASAFAEHHAVRKRYLG